MCCLRAPANPEQNKRERWGKKSQDCYDFSDIRWGPGSLVKSLEASHNEAIRKYKQQQDDDSPRDQLMKEYQALINREVEIWAIVERNSPGEGWFGDDDVRNGLSAGYQKRLIRHTSILGTAIGIRQGFIKLRKNKTRLLHPVSDIGPKRQSISMYCCTRVWGRRRAQAQDHEWKT